MREIKFRAWNMTLNTWIYFGMEGIPKEIECDIDYTIVYQYTGLKDKNGVEIYDGDMLDEKWKLEVYFKNSAYYVKVPHGENHKKEMLLYDWLKHREKAGIPQEVIGNIYEKLELVEKEIK